MQVRPRRKPAEKSTRLERAYNRFCPLSLALDELGDRWTIHIVYHLLTGPKRYTDLRDYLAGAGSNVLGERLTRLAANQIVERSVGSGPGSDITYRLTERGFALAPVIRGLAGWGLRSMVMANPSDPDRVEFNQRWAIGSAGPLKPETFQWTIDGSPFSLSIDGYDLTRTRGRAKSPAARFETTTDVLTRVLGGEFTVPEGARAGALQLSGSVAAQRRMFLVTGFPTYALGGLALQ